MVKIVKNSFEILSDTDGDKALKHIELCARNCYKSEGSISEDVSSAKRMIGKLIELGHTAMLEHYSITVRLNCSVGCYKELTRHRMASYAIESTRWCSYDKDKFGKEIKVILPNNIDESSELYDIWLKAMEDSERYYFEMAKKGGKPDQIRSVLPHSTCGSTIITANIRSWRNIFELRCAKDAHPEIRELMKLVLKEFHKIYPVFFDDLYNKFCGGE